ncbi:MAG: ABC transporter ATP-binding protein [Spirochaetales bacterium]|nr:ABC transporter ATP-binding protein [Spirochaetales bacterium]
MIRLRNLEYTYPGRQSPAVNGITCEIGKGEIFGFLGPNGAGKSTTQKILIGLLKNYRGKVEIFGKNPAALKGDYYQKIGVAFEFPNLYSKCTGLENLLFFQSLYKEKGKDPEVLLESLGLGKDAHLRVSEYSKGMKMRLNFARALLNDPEILFLDEPTSGLDPVNARLLKDMILSQKNEGKTIFLTTHDMNVAAELCDRVAFLVEGRISLIDRPESLKRDFGRGEVSVTMKNGHGETERQFSLSGLGRNTDFLSFLTTGEVLTIHSQEATLEDVFIKVTGRKLL